MSFYYKSYNNPDYNSFSLPYKNFEKIIVEIGDHVYILGSIFSNNLQRRMAYISKRDIDGNIIAEKGIDIQDMQENELCLTNIFELSNGNLVLTIHDNNQLLMICLSASLEQIIWYKKYYDKKDVTVLFNDIELYIDTSLLIDNEMLVTVKEMQRGGDFYLSNFQFITINLTTGDIILSKKISQTENIPFIDVFGIRSDSSNVVLTGNIGDAAFIIVIDQNINIKKKWFFTANTSYTNVSISGYDLSNVNNGKLMLRGGIRYQQVLEKDSKELIGGQIISDELNREGYDNKNFFLEIDLISDVIQPALLINNQNAATSTRNSFMEYDENNLYYSNGGIMWKMSLSDNQHLWKKYIIGYPAVEAVHSDHTYSFSNYAWEIPSVYVFAKLNKDYNSCKTVSSNIYETVDTFLLQTVTHNLLLTTNTLPTYITPNLDIINILFGTQSDICSPESYYSLKLESHTIGFKNFFVSQAISANSLVGHLTISNIGSAEHIISPNTLIIPILSDIQYKTGDAPIYISSGSTVIVPVYVSGTPTQIGYFSSKIDITNPKVDNPNIYEIAFNVEIEPINAEITDSTGLLNKAFTKGLPNSFPDESYGSFIIHNYTSTRPLIINAQNIVVNSGFVFSIPFIEIDPGQMVPIPVSVRAENTIQSETGGHAAAIVIPFVKNAQSLHKIIFEIKDELFDIQFTGIILNPDPLSFVEGYNYPRQAPRSIGKVIIKNFTQTREFNFSATTLDIINGLEFKIKSFSLKRFNQIGDEQYVEIIVIQAASAVGNFICPIDLLPDIKNPNQFNIPFVVVQDVLNVEINNAAFNYPRFVKNSPFTGKHLGVISIINNSLVQPFILKAHTKIHQSLKIAGLVFQTSNEVDLTLAPGDNPAIKIELNPASTTPTEFGHFNEYIYIEGVKIGAVPYFLNFDVFNNGIEVITEPNLLLQTPSFALQAVGSKGIDSPKGIQLRWLFGGNLGDKHLPKGDLALGDSTYNKPEDYVHVYKVPYTNNVRARTRLDLARKPYSINDSKQYWIYKLNLPITDQDDTLSTFELSPRIIYVYFRNKQKYKDARKSYDPFLFPFEFIESYGENIIEIENKEDLFFRVSPLTNKLFMGNLYLEVLSVENNNPIGSKFLSYRKKMNPGEVRNSKIIVENGRSIRFKKEGTSIQIFEFEYYSDFITSASYWKAWQEFGNYALTNTANLKILNTILGDINGKWLRYNDGEFVKKQNYIDKWNYTSSGTSDLKRGIREIVEKYIFLSNGANNPRAEEYLDFNFANPNGEIITEPIDPMDEDGNTLISYLDLLKIASTDYHVARLLGLGVLDVNNDTFSADEFIYLTEYKTLKNPLDENDLKSYQLLSMSLPTSINTERLPIPVDIGELKKGISNQPNEDIPALYDDDGYTFDGKSRFVSIISKPLPHAEINPSFFSNSLSWDASLYSLPIYAGLEYKIGSDVDSLNSWVKPELSHDSEFRTIKYDGQSSSLEPIPILLPENFGDPLYIHRQTESGTYYYSTYGINIFSRSTNSNFTSNINTLIKPKNTLLPPSNIKSWLIVSEKPLMFTSLFEQQKYAEIVGADKTFVRLNFDYNSLQDLITYSIPSDSGIEDGDYIREIDIYFPDKYDIFADYFETYYRKETPKNISARLYEVKPYLKNNLCAIFRTKEYYFVSTGETYQSISPQDTPLANFIGSIFLVNNKSYVIKEIKYGVLGLEFIVYKEEVSQTILSGGSISIDFSLLTMPITSGNDLFVVIENMQSTTVWGDIKNPNSFQVPLQFPEIRREIITSISENGSTQKFLEKSRGYWQEAVIEPHKENDVHKGFYKITVTDIPLNISQNLVQNGFFEMNNGYVRVFRNNSISGNIFKKSRDILKVIKTEPFGRNMHILYVYDNNFKFDDNGNPSGNLPGDEIQTGNNITINYYPSYYLYLYKDPLNDLTADSVLPVGEKLTKHSIFGLRSVDIDNKDIERNFYKSKFSVPSIIVGQKIIDPKTPEKPEGSLYATRPDFYGKSTYTFTTKFQQKPYGVQFCRTDNNALLNALYETEKIKEIYINLSALGGNDEEFLANRWANFFDFSTLKLETNYHTYPENNEFLANSKNKEKFNEELVIIPEILDFGYAFPLPNKIKFFEGINSFIDIHNQNTNQTVPHIEENKFGLMNLLDVVIPATMNNTEIVLLDFIKEVIDNSFVPLTEIPIIYQLIKKLPYLPISKKQNIRDKSGFLLKPPPNLNEISEFDIAPMMTILNEAENRALFTDFTLNGVTNNLYFYACREIGSQMNMSDLSPVLGPVKTVDSNAPEQPKILSGVPILENKVLGIKTKIKVEVHPYLEVIRIQKINLYRAENRLDAESILSMKLVQQLEVSDIEITESKTWAIYDTMEHFEQIPFGDILFYKVTVEKKIQYSDPQPNLDGTPKIIIDYAPSKASKIMALMLTETISPDSPNLEGSGIRPIDADFVNSVILEWNQTCYKGVYHLYSMSTQGNWKEIARFLVNGTNDKVQLQVYNPSSVSNEETWQNKEILNVFEGKILLPLNSLGAEYSQFPLFDNEGNRMYYHFKMVAENTSNMFSNQENMLTLFPDTIWDNLTGISSDDNTNGMIIQKTFIIK